MASVSSVRLIKAPVWAALVVLLLFLALAVPSSAGSEANAVTQDRGPVPVSDIGGLAPVDDFDGQAATIQSAQEVAATPAAVQFTGTLSPNQTARWFTYNWPASSDVSWYVVPTSPNPGAPQVEWTVGVERASAQFITYWITVRNLTNFGVSIEGRYVVVNS